MDFFAQQEKARRATGFLVVLYALAILGTVAAIYAIALAVMGYISNEPVQNLEGNSYLLFGCIAAPLAIIALGSLVKVSELSAGGPAVSKSLGGREISPNTQDIRERRLLNVVEEMAIAAGIRVPTVFVLDNEDGINAFAAGYSSQDASVTVTRGALVALNRDELQGVIGHEFSHILNGDMRLNIWLIGALAGILCIAVIGTGLMRVGGEILRFRPRRSGKKNDAASIAAALFLAGVAVWIIGSIGHFFGRLIQAAVSRKRECLADASSVQFTRNPGALAGALKLIGANATQGLVRSAEAAEISHMFFVSGLSSVFATHPPLEQRIRLLDPSFDGDYSPYSKVLRQRLAAAPQTAADTDESDLHSVLLATLVARSALKGGTPQPPPATAFLNASELQALSDPLSAEACLYATLLDRPQSTIRARQLAAIGEAAPEAEAWSARHPAWSSAERRAAAELAFRTLRGLDPARRAAIAAAIDALAGADKQIDSFEFALSRMMKRRFAPAESLRRPAVPVTALRPQMRTVLSALAWFGDRTGAAAPHAYVTGWNHRAGDPGEPGAPEPADLARLDAALDKLNDMTPYAKQNFLAACRAVVNDDAIVTEDESNLLAAIADSIGADGWAAA